MVHQLCNIADRRVSCCLCGRLGETRDSPVPPGQILILAMIIEDAIDVRLGALSTFW
jgi:hypothetical protein